MASDVIRLNKDQKESIDKLIPSLISEYESMDDFGVEGFKYLISHHLEALKNKDYSTIISLLIVKSAEQLNIELYK